MRISKKLGIATLGAALAAIGVGQVGRAIVATDADALANELVPVGQYTGVVSLDTGASASTASSFCTGSLLPGGLHILTAAHCLTTNTGALDPLLATQPTFATFYNTSEIVQIPIQDFYLFPDWNGSLGRGNDIAVLLLATAAPSDASQYDIYRNTDEVGQVFTKVGYGEVGTGAVGETPGLNNSVFAFAGQNQFDATDAALATLLPGDEDVPISGSQLLFDFDSGLAANNLLGNLGLGTAEVNIALGDSGSPAFIGNRIGGVTSYGIGGFATDVDQDTNSSFGELSSETRVSTYASFVDQAIAGTIPSALPRNVSAAPEPSTLLGTVTFGIGGILTLRKHKKRQ